MLRLRRQHVDAECRAVDRELPLPDGSSSILAGQILEGTPSPSEQVAEEETARRLRQALAKLEEPDQEVLLMRHFEQLSNQEVATVLSLTEAAASMRYLRAIRRLRALLTSEEK